MAGLVGAEPERHETTSCGHSKGVFPSHPASEGDMGYLKSRSAWFGFLITAGVPAVIGGLQILLMPAIVRNIVPGVLEFEVNAYARAYRYSLIPLYLGAFAGIAAYWLIFAFRAPRPDAGRAANLTLALAGLWFAGAMLIVSTVPQPINLLKPGCALFGLPDTTEVYGFDALSECEAFLFRYGQLPFWGIPIALMIASLAFRTFSARPRSGANGS